MYKVYVRAMYIEGYTSQNPSASAHEYVLVNRGMESGFTKTKDAVGRKVAVREGRGQRRILLYIFVFLKMVDPQVTMGTNLVGGIPTPLKNINVNGKDCSIYDMEVKKVMFETTNQ